jgi:hypothetical protein
MIKQLLLLNEMSDLVQHPFLCLLYEEDEPLEILAFRMIDVDGVIGRLMQLVQDAHFAMSQRSCGEDGIAAMIFRNNL